MIRAASLALAASLSLAACGADGAPEPPASPPPAQSGLSFSGAAKIGVSIR